MLAATVLGVAVGISNGGAEARRPEEPTDGTTEVLKEEDCWVQNKQEDDDGKANKKFEWPK